MRIVAFLRMTLGYSTYRFGRGREAAREPVGRRPAREPAGRRPARSPGDSDGQAGRPGGSDGQAGSPGGSDGPASRPGGSDGPAIPDNSRRRPFDPYRSEVGRNALRIAKLDENIARLRDLLLKIQHDSVDSYEADGQISDLLWETVYEWEEMRVFGIIPSFSPADDADKQQLETLEIILARIEEQIKKVQDDTREEDPVPRRHAMAMLTSEKARLKRRISELFKRHLDRTGPGDDPPPHDKRPVSVPTPVSDLEVLKKANQVRVAGNAALGGQVSDLDYELCIMLLKQREAMSRIHSRIAEDYRTIDMDTSRIFRIQQELNLMPDTITHAIVTELSHVKRDLLLEVQQVQASEEEVPLILEFETYGARLARLQRNEERIQELAAHRQTLTESLSDALDLFGSEMDNFMSVINISVPSDSPEAAGVGGHPPVEPDPRLVAIQRELETGLINVRKYLLVMETERIELQKHVTDFTGPDMEVKVNQVELSLVACIGDCERAWLETVTQYGRADEMDRLIDRRSDFKELQYMQDTKTTLRTHANTVLDTLETVLSQGDKFVMEFPARHEIMTGEIIKKVVQGKDSLRSMQEQFKTTFLPPRSGIAARLRSLLPRPELYKAWCRESLAQRLCGGTCTP